MPISKTDFIRFAHCPNSFWLEKHRPEDYPHVELSDFDQKLAAEAHEFKTYVQGFIMAGADADHFDFGKAFQSDRGLRTTADMVRNNEDGTITIYEVNSATGLRKTAKQNDLKEACFQMLAAEELGNRVSEVIIVHLDGGYVRQGDINPSDLLVFVDVTSKVKDIEDETQQQIYDALALLATQEIDETACTCLSLTKKNHCDSFSHFNQNIPDPSIYDLPRASKKQLEAFAGEGRFGLDDIDVKEVAKRQGFVLQSAQQKSPLIDPDAMAKWFAQACYPLYFIDYETYSSAIPIVDGAKPYGHIPFQYSLHVKRSPDDTELDHFEYLEDTAVLPLAMIEHMEQQIGPEGSVISWYSSFENTQNNTMAQQFPDKAKFLQGLIDRTLDLEKLFHEAYVDIAFRGSTSIKKVLPVLAPDLDYEGMAVANGTDAMAAWKQLIGMPDGAEKDQLRTDMFEYCKLDTYAMVRIFELMRLG